MLAGFFMAAPRNSRMHDLERAARQSLIDTCIAMNASGLSLGKSGNASLRWGDGLLISPTGTGSYPRSVRAIVCSNTTIRSRVGQ